MSVNVREVDWQDWITDELKSMPFDQRAEILICAIRHNDLTSLLISREMSAMEKFRLASALRDVADILENQAFCKRSGN
jgi:hypothetical protein